MGYFLSWKVRMKPQGVTSNEYTYICLIISMRSLFRLYRRVLIVGSGTGGAPRLAELGEHRGRHSVLHRGRRVHCAFRGHIPDGCDHVGSRAAGTGRAEDPGGAGVGSNGG